MEDRLMIGEIVATVGLKGEVRVRPLTDTPQDFEGFDSCWLELGDIKRPLVIATLRYTRSMVVLSFEGYQSLEAVKDWVGAFLFILRSQKRLKQGQYYIVDLEGCKVVLEDGTQVGIVSHVYQGAHDLLEVQRPDEREILIPMVDQFIKKVDLDNKTILLTPIQGLLEP